MCQCAGRAENIKTNVKHDKVFGGPGYVVSPNSTLHQIACSCWLVT
jgi:hypothetical protein